MAGESLRVVAGNAAGASIGLEQELVIGRATPGDGSLGGDGEISRVHARIYRDASGQLTVEDLGSTNGTFVNGSRITAATPLRPGGQGRMGQTTMTVEGGAADPGAPSAGNGIPPAGVEPPPAPVTPPTQQLPPVGQPPGGPPPGGSPPDVLPAVGPPPGGSPLGGPPPG